MSSEQTPLVSIAMCTYNGEKFLREQLDSLINQDYKNYELIIVDDCSTDTTHSILKEYADEYSYIELHLNAKNLGFKKNFEKALTLVKGEFIALCDQDDIWFPNKISIMASKIGPNTLIFSNSEMVDEDGKYLLSDFYSYIKMTPHSRTTWQSLIFDNYILGHNMFFRKELLRHALPMPNSFKEHDHWLAICAASTGTVAYLPEILGRYRVHDANCTIKKKIRKKRSFTGIIRYISKRYHKLLSVIDTYKLRIDRVDYMLETDIISVEEKNDLLTIKEAYQCSFFSKLIKRDNLKNLMKQNSPYSRGCYNHNRYVKSITRSFLASIFR